MMSRVLNGETDFGQRALEIWRDQCGRSVATQQVSIIQEKARSGVYLLRGAGHGNTDIIVKRGRTEKLGVEYLMYTTWLARLPVPVLRCLAYLEGSDDFPAWLFLEHADGGSYRRQDPRHRDLLARWLAMFHTSAVNHSSGKDLPDRSPAFYRWCMDTTYDALVKGLENPAASAEQLCVIHQILDSFRQLELVWPRIEQVCSMTPQTLVHGDLLPKNIRVLANTHGVHPLVFDWEYAGWGTPLVDLVQSNDFDKWWSAPDLRVYHANIQHRWPQLTLADLEKGAPVARLFHLLLWIHGDAQHVSGPWLDRSFAKLAAYQIELERILRLHRWED